MQINSSSIVLKFTVNKFTTQLKGSMKEQNMFHNYETEKITRKASDVEENLQL